MQVMRRRCLSSRGLGLRRRRTAEAAETEVVTVEVAVATRPVRAVATVVASLLAARGVHLLVVRRHQEAATTAAVVRVIKATDKVMDKVAATEPEADQEAVIHHHLPLVVMVEAVIHHQLRRARSDQVSPLDLLHPRTVRPSSRDTAAPQAAAVHLPALPIHRQVVDMEAEAAVVVVMEEEEEAVVMEDAATDEPRNHELMAMLCLTHLACVIVCPHAASSLVVVPIVLSVSRGLERSGNEFTCVA